MSKDELIVMPKYTQPTINEIFAGMDEVMANEEKRINEIAPRCHFRPMALDSVDQILFWWECSVCGHTKEA